MYIGINVLSNIENKFKTDKLTDLWDLYIINKLGYRPKSNIISK